MLLSTPTTILFLSITKITLAHVNSDTTPHNRLLVEKERTHNEFQYQDQQTPLPYPNLYSYDDDDYPYNPTTPPDEVPSDETDLSSSFSNPSGIHQVTDIGVDAVGSAIVFNLIMFIILMGIYEVVSRIIPSIYSGRKNHVDTERVPISIPYSHRPFRWVGAVAGVTWAQVRKGSGLDAYMYLRYIQLCLQIVVVSGFWGMVVLFPVFATGGGGAVGWYHVSIANVEEHSEWRFWFPCIFLWLFSLYVFFLMNEEFKHFMDVRMDFLIKGDKDVHPQNLYSIMIENIPNELRSDKALYDYFSTLFPEKVHCASIVMSIPDLESLCNRRQRVTRRLEKSFAIYETTGSRPTHIVGQKRMMWCGIESLPIFSFGVTEKDDDYEGNDTPQRGERVDSINYYTRDLIRMNEKIERVQREKMALAQTGNEMVQASEWIASTIEDMTDAAAVSLESSRDDGLLVGFDNGNIGFHGLAMIKNGFGFFFGALVFFKHHFDAVVESVVGNALSSTGFVTFKDRFSATSASNSRICPKPDVLTVGMAPDVRDIVWENAHMSTELIAGRQATANFLLVIGVLFWSVPVTLIQAMATVDNIAKIPGMEWVESFNGGHFANFINGYLPVIALLGLINILPLIFERIATVYEDRKTLSDVQNSILGRFFYYQLANIYITVTAHSLFDSLAGIIDHPSSALMILGQTVPTVVGYFIALLITKILVGLPFIMLRFDALFRLGCIKMCCRRELMTRRELDEVKRKQMFWYGWEYPTQLLVIVIVFTYACISPIIFPVAALYFIFALVVYKKQVLLTYTPLFESGGKMFPTVCNLTLIGLICAQATLAGYILIRKAYYELLTLLPLPWITYRMMKFFRKTYAEPSEGLNLEIARELDKGGEYTFNEDIYRQPVLTEPKAEPSLYRLDRMKSKSRRQQEQEQGLGEQMEGQESLNGDSAALELSPPPMEETSKKKSKKQKKKEREQESLVMKDELFRVVGSDDEDEVNEFGGSLRNMV